ncbi:hypothetical protein LJR153_002108 [Paenibacillus sp. LjRoot153]|uniref:hypothetical protein n=1 Tax=Paenibacillus sp. LjRoot153 TaxID=3342270 RepID=UPI003ECFA52C
MVHITPKITLQPLVENAILHGILAKDNQEGAILIGGNIANKVITITVQVQLGDIEIPDIIISSK